jgi:uncharacterized protein (DUF433 family)
MTTSLELEAEKMRRVPGIIFVDGFSGRRARIAGTGLEVFEIILNYRAVGEDWGQLKECFPWLSDEQLRAAVTYYETYPDEINAELEDNARYTPEYVYEKYPFTRPQPR